MDSKVFVVIVAIIFLLTQSGCATVKTNQVQTNVAYSGDSLNNRTAQWEREEKEWWLVALIILGVAAALGATIAISSGGGGFSAGVNK